MAPRCIASCLALRFLLQSCLKFYIAFAEDVAGPLGCCCDPQKAVEECALEAYRSALPAAAVTSAVVLKVVGIDETIESVCASAAWAQRFGYHFAVLGPEDVSTHALRSLEQVAKWLEQPGGSWLAILPEHVLPVRYEHDIVRDMIAEGGTSEVHLLSTRASLAAVFPAASEPEGLVLLRQSTVAARVVKGLLRHEDELLVGRRLHRALSTLDASGQTPIALRLLRAGSPGSAHDGTAPATPVSRQLLALAGHSHAVQAAVARAILPEACRVRENDAQYRSDGGTREQVDIAFLEALKAQADADGAAPPGPWGVPGDGLRLARALEVHGRLGEASAEASAAAARVEVGRLQDASELLARAALHVRLGSHLAAHSDCKRASFTESERPAALACMAEALQNMGRSEEATASLRSLLVLMVEGRDHSGMAAAIAGLASASASQHRLEEAEHFATRVVRLQHDRLAPKHPGMLEPLGILATIWRTQGRVQKSLQMLDRILQIQRSSLPHGHPHISTTLNNLAYLLLEEKRSQESMPLLKEAVQSAARCLGAGHETVVSMLLNMAAAHELERDSNKAENIYLRIAALRASTQTSATDGQWRARLGRLLHGGGRHAESLETLRTALSVWRGLGVPGESGEVTTAAGTLGAVLHSLGRHAESVEVLRGVAAIQGQTLGAGDPRTAQTLANLGVALHGAGRGEEARFFLKRGESDLEQLGTDSPQVQAVRMNLESLERDRALAGPASIVEGLDINVEGQDVVDLADDTIVLDGW
mmetsp:Transcript_29245/g.97093  ORF Transcript_29245/g.97093 Transcript_29245/m.97093 type:complete len:766 (+) Transcript_29245:80-2377(+)